MTTWSCKTSAAVLALWTLAACEGGQLPPLLGPASGGPAAGITRASMAGGALTLVPPQGYCIDRRNLESRFALLARCDKLGVGDASAGAPLGVITVSLSDSPTATPLPTADETAAILGVSNVTLARTSDNAVIFRAVGPRPVRDMANRHWRATARIGSFLMGLAFYGPAGGRVEGAEGGNILADLIARTEAETSQ